MSYSHRYHHMAAVSTAIILGLSSIPVWAAEVGDSKTAAATESAAVQANGNAESAEKQDSASKQASPEPGKTPDAGGLTAATPSGTSSNATQTAETEKTTSASDSAKANPEGTASNASNPVIDLSSYQPCTSTGDPVEGASLPYTGSQIEAVSFLKPIAQAEGTPTQSNLTNDKKACFTVRYLNNKYAPDKLGDDGKPAASTAVAVIKAVPGSGFGGEIVCKFSIRKTDLSNADEVSVEVVASDGKPSVSAKTSKGVALKEGIDFSVSYDAATGKVELSALPGASSRVVGKRSCAFKTADAKNLSNAAVDSIADQEWTGKAIEPHPAVKLGGKTLTEGTDYALTYANNVDEGSASVTATGKNGYSGSATVTFSIVKKDDGQGGTPTGSDSPAENPTAQVKSIASAKVGPIEPVVFDGKKKEPALSVTLAGKKIVAGTDFDVSYRKNVNAGTAEAILTGKGGYSGTSKATFSIKPRDVSKINISQASTGGISATCNGITLKAGKSADYTVSSTKDMAGKKVTFTVVGCGNYTGKKTVSFKLALDAQHDLSKAKVSGLAKKYLFKSKAVKPVPTVKIGSKTLKNGRDYTLSYSKNAKPGKASMSILGKGSYGGTKSIQFNIGKLPSKLSMKGKRVLVLGDSIQAGAGKFAVAGCEQLGANVTNKAVGGAVIAKKHNGNNLFSQIDRVRNLGAFDYYVIAAGTNDCACGYQTGPKTSTDNQTVSGALNEIIGKITKAHVSQKKSNPAIIVVTPIGKTSQRGHALDGYRKAISKVAGRYKHVTVIDGLSIASNAEMSRGGGHTGDGVHPHSGWASSTMAKRFRSQLNKQREKLYSYQTEYAVKTTTAKSKKSSGKK